MRGPVQVAARTSPRFAGGGDKLGQDRRAQPRRDQLTEAEAARAGEVFEQHQQFIERVARRHAPGPDHVPDIVGAVAIQVCRGLNGFRDESQVTTWLYRVTVNTARSYWLAEHRHQRRVEAVRLVPTPEPYLDPDEVVQQVERVEALEDAIDQLTPFHQSIVRHQLRNQSVGSDVQFGSKASRHRARRQLRELLTDDPRLEP